MSFRIVQLVTIALTLFAPSHFMHYVQCLQMNMDATGMETTALKLQRQERANETPELPTAADEDVAYCESIEREAYCTSGITQSLIDAVLYCGDTTNLELTLESATGCFRSESGAFCESFSTRSFITEQKFEENCLEVVFTKKCVPKCRTRLEDVREKLGCCINAHFNRSFSLFYFNYNLWNLCGVPLPPPACEDRLRLNPPATERNCDSEHIAQNLICSNNTGQAYINGLLEDSRCSQINLNVAKEVVLLCSVKADGTLCSEDGFDISLLNSNCNVEINNASAVCTPMCRDTLEMMRSTAGCCINTFNQSDGAETETQSALDYRLWKSCGVETPGFCESKLTLDVTISTTAAVRIIINGATSIYLKYTFLYTTQFILVLITSLVMILIHNNM